MTLDFVKLIVLTGVEGTDHHEEDDVAVRSGDDLGIRVTPKQIRV